MDFYKRTIAVVTLPSACFTKIGVLHAGDGTVERVFGSHWCSNPKSSGWGEQIIWKPARTTSLQRSIIIVRWASSSKKSQVLVCKWSGSLPVFPVPLAISWISSNQNFASILPVRPCNVTKFQLKTYGSKLTRTISLGGGPFMLKDSGDLETWLPWWLMECDFTEAWNCFWNATQNKKRDRIWGGCKIEGDIPVWFLQWSLAAWWHMHANCSKHT